jgi:hypothetical protein
LSWRSPRGRAGFQRAACLSAKICVPRRSQKTFGGFVRCMQRISPSSASASRYKSCKSKKRERAWSRNNCVCHECTSNTWVSTGWGNPSVAGAFLTYTVVPGPGAFALLGLAGLVSRRRR